jgi:hypothetical protein
MPKRVDFTLALSQLIMEMKEAGEHPLFDWGKRSAHDQKVLFDEGKSKCDGVKKVSAHQKSLAMDIYFDDGDGNLDPIRPWSYWHTRWVELGGRPLIYLGPNKTKPDYAHFEWGIV